MSTQDSTAGKLGQPPTEPGNIEAGINPPNAAAASAEGVSLGTHIATPAEEEAPRRTSPWIALRHRDFRLLWGGSFVSQAGSQMTLVAVSVQLWDLTHDYTAVGLRGLFRMLPLIVLSLFGGVIADALDRRKLMMLTQSTLALTSLLFALSSQFGWASPLSIYALTALAASANAFDNPARSALIPNLVPRKHLPNALSLNIIISEMATIGGPLFAGLFLPLRSQGYALIYWIDAISFTAVLIAVFMMRTRPQQAATRDISLRAAFEGLHFLRRTPIIMSTMTIDFFATFFGAATVLIPAFAEQVLHIDRQYWGLLYAAPAVGALLAGFVMSWLGNVRHQGVIVLVSVAAYGAATFLFGASTAFLLTLLALAGTGAADTVSMVMRQTIRQLSTPDELRGRMTSVNMLFYVGGPQLGEFEAGLAASVIGLGPSVMVGGLAVIIISSITGYLVPTLRNYDRDKT